MAGKPDRALLKAVLEPQRPGALETIRKACADGANPDGICPATSTAAGPVPAGSTLLTQSIRAGASKAVKALLEAGADPNLADENGWTPWIASTFVDDPKKSRIQEALRDRGAVADGEHIAGLATAIASGDTERASALTQSEDDYRILSTFRVDLLGHQVRTGNSRMLEFLLEHGMSASTTNLINAVRSGNAEAVEIMLRHGMAPERAGGGETPLMVAAGLGHRRIAELLLDAGADPNRAADEAGEFTPAFHARQAGHAELADWLQSRMSDEAVERTDGLVGGRDPAFAKLYEQATMGEGCSTDDIVAVLSRWNAEFGVTVVDASPATVVLRFEKLPQDTGGLLADLRALAADTAGDEAGLRKQLKREQTLTLWWD